MTLYIRQPFASSGDKISIPFPTQVDGTVSYAQGFGFDYSRDKATDPLAKDVPREQSNELYYVITDNIQFWQQHAAPEYVADSDGLSTPFAYSIGAIVRWRASGGDPWRSYVSNVDSNTDDPSDPAAWSPFVFRTAENTDTTSTDRIATPAYVTHRLSSFSVSVPPASTTVAGITEYATDAETIAGAPADRAVTPSGLAAAAAAGEWATPAASTTVSGRVELATDAETAAFVDATRAVTPAGLGFAIPQATTAAIGRVRLATSAEATAQVLGTGYAVPPNALSGYARLGQNVSFNLTQSTTGFDVTSSRKVKTCLRANPYGLADVLQIETACGFYRRDYVDDGRERLFLIAEQLDEVVPHAVSPAGACYNGEPVPTICYDALVPVLIQALQEEYHARVRGQHVAIVSALVALGCALAALFGG